MRPGIVLRNVSMPRLPTTKMHCKMPETVTGRQGCRSGTSQEHRHDKYNFKKLEICGPYAAAHWWEIGKQVVQGQHRIQLATAVTAVIVAPNLFEPGT